MQKAKYNAGAILSPSNVDIMLYGNEMKKILLTMHQPEVV
jgi:hypothetical protein